MMHIYSNEFFSLFTVIISSLNKQETKKRNYLMNKLSLSSNKTCSRYFRQFEVNDMSQVFEFGVNYAGFG